ADPYSAWQRGSNENANGLVRQYLPRSMDCSTITDDYLRWIEQRLYNIPMKILGYITTLAVFGTESIHTDEHQNCIHRLCPPDTDAVLITDHPQKMIRMIIRHFRWGVSKVVGFLPSCMPAVILISGLQTGV